MTLNFTIGDIVAIAAMIGTVTFNYFSIVRRVDSIISRHSSLSTSVEDLRRGRGLILGPESDWPPMVRRCFGYYSTNDHVKP